MSELAKELEQDKAFIERVADRIYKDTDDWEETIPEPEWIDRMTWIAEKYITRFETSYNFANSLADELLASNIQFNANQKIVLEWLKWSVKEQGNSAIDAIFLLRTGEAFDSVLLALKSLNNQQQTEVLAAFAQWGLEHDI